MSVPEFNRPVRVDLLGPEPRPLSIAADETEREALAKRFGLVGIERLAAEVSLVRNGEEVFARGEVSAAVIQRCVASGEPVAAVVETPLETVFRPHPSDIGPDEEVELDESELDVVFYEGTSVDIGEAVAETLFLSLDPYPRAPDAEAALKAAGVKSEEEAGPFAALAALRDKLER